MASLRYDQFTTVLDKYLDTRDALKQSPAKTRNTHAIFVDAHYQAGIELDSMMDEIYDRTKDRGEE